MSNQNKHKRDKYSIEFNNMRHSQLIRKAIYASKAADIPSIFFGGEVEESLGAPIYILKPGNIIFSQIFTALNFNHYQIGNAWIFKSMANSRFDVS